MAEHSELNPAELIPFLRSATALGHSALAILNQRHILTFPSVESSMCVVSFRLLTCPQGILYIVKIQSTWLLLNAKLFSNHAFFYSFLIGLNFIGISFGPNSQLLKSFSCLFAPDSQKRSC